MLEGSSRRDPEVQAIVDHFDRLPLKHDDWSQLSYEERFSLLKRAEREAILEQVELCTDDFNYAARNYFWITNNYGQDQLFTLWESQWLVLQKYYELKAKGKAQKILILKARRLGMCLDPGTRVLTEDFRWVPISSVTPGQGLVSVDEIGPGGRGNARKMRKAIAIAKNEVTEPAFRLTMDNGEVLIATGGHRFLCKKRGASWTEWRSVTRQTTKKTSSPIIVGDEIRYITQPWENQLGYEDGWFGGMLDGEGSFRARKEGGVEATVSQVPGPVLERAKRYLQSRGYTFHLDVDDRKPGESSKLGDTPIIKLVVNRMNEIFRLMGQTRPERFLNKRWWEGKDLPGKRSGIAWSKVVSIEPLGPRVMVDLQTSTGTFIAEGFVSHNSLLIENMIAWRTMFYPNTEALVVSVTEDDSRYLFSFMLHTYEMMPWWLKPQARTLEYKQGLHFDNPDREQGRLKPGLNSHIYIQHSTQTSGVGQGHRISAGHVSEYADFLQARLEEIIEGDLLASIHDNPENFCFLESTGKGAGTYSHQLWKSCVKRAERAEWYPLFLPWFFESTRREYSLPNNFTPHKPEVMMRERVKGEWSRCDNKDCGQFHSAAMYGEDCAGMACPSCGNGKLTSYVLDDFQLYWKQIRRENAEDKGKDSLKKHKQEFSTSAEESWQLSGMQVFDEAVQEVVGYTLRDPNKWPGVKQGYIDTYGRFHGVRGIKGGCWVDGCTADHRFDEVTFIIWEMPEKDREYACGVDVAEGIGEDSSVIWVNKLGVRGQPDEQVAVYRSNEVEPYDLAFYCNAIGVMYNSALMSIEYNIFQTTADRVRINFNYPNLFRWKHLDHQNVMSQTWHWLTQYNTKSKLWQTGRKWLRSGNWVVRDPVFLDEMQTFQKDEDDSKSAKHERGAHDDSLMAGLIALYCSHEMDADDQGIIRVPTEQQMNEPCRYRMWCQSCGYGKLPDEQGRYVWGTNNPEDEYRCPQCGSIKREAAPMEDQAPSAVLTDAEWTKLAGSGVESGAAKPLNWEHL